MNYFFHIIHFDTMNQIMNQKYNFYCTSEYVLINGDLVASVEALKMAILCDRIDVIMHLEKYASSLFNKENIYKAFNLAADQGSSDVIRYFIEYYKSKKYNKKEFYKGPINHQTEENCAICLEKMNTEEKEILQCKTCKKCVHNECSIKWTGSCVYCRS